MLQVVWFKRDLRCCDHQPLIEAVARGPVLPLYVVEPELWAQSDASARQWLFCAESLRELQERLAELGQPLVVRQGSALAVLRALHRQRGIAQLWSHQETGNDFSYARDRQVAAWCRQEGIPWSQPQNFGVIRALANRAGWAPAWEALMAKPQHAAPAALAPLADLEPGGIPSAAELGLAPDPCPGRQRGGRRQGLDLLNSFLAQRGRNYSRELSSPLTAFRACSRLSAHLSFGTLSMRELVQTARQARSSRAFISRLHWHCHFIQKLESKPALEFQNSNRAYDGLRSSNDEWLQAWSEGRTGWPFVDACMRALHHHGWINFRMRAMLMSVASYQLWLPWRDSGGVLARLFVDYEPGIHWNQCQMQSGTTGINAIRIYNPIKQGLDHDPNGDFIRRWIPELSELPATQLHTPWQLGCTLPSAYPAPLVDYEAAARSARDQVWALRKGRTTSKRSSEAQGQLSLDLG
jgi:deoxyribodipyrimidine photo-lyase